MTGNKLKEILGVPRGAIVMIALLILTVEFLIMALIGFFLNTGDYFWRFMDPVLLTLIVTPGIYILAVRALKKQQALVQRQFNEQSIAAVTFESREGIMVTDSNGKILRVNRSFTQITGYTNEEVIGKTPAILRSGRHDRQFYRNMWDTLKRDGSWNGEIWNRRRDGEIYPEWLTITAVRGNEGAVTNYVGLFLDITRRMQLERESTRLHHRNQILMDTSLDGIHVMSVNGDLLEANDAFCRMLGYTQEEIMRLNVADWDAKLTTDELRSAFREIMGKSAVVETIHRCKDGVLINVEISVAGRNIDGHDYIFASSRNITERKQAEALLRDNEERLRAIFQTLSEGVALNEIVFDDDGEMVDYKILAVNRAFYKIVEFTHDVEVTGRLATGLYGISGEEIKAFWSAHKDEVNVTYSETICPITKKYVGVWTSPFENNRFVTSYVDVTERKANEQQLHELAAHIQTVREEEKTSLAREIHDELGGTLTALKMDAYWLAGKLSGDGHAPLREQVESMTGLIDSAVNATRRIITDLRPTVLDDLGLMAALEWQCREFGKRTGIACEIVGGESGGEERSLNKTVAINLFRIFQEALSNVAKHSGATRVEVEFHQRDDGAILSISDNGRGMPKGYTVRQSSYGQRGMRERVAQLGGRLSFDSPPGGGFRILVTLPPAVSHQNESAA